MLFLFSPLVNKKVEERNKMMANNENFKLSKYLRRRAALDSFRISTYGLKLLFSLVLIYVVVITFALILQEAAAWLMDIINYSVMGFVTFFMGWFGWEIAKDLRNFAFSQKSKK